MECRKCLKEFPENELQLSHDVPKYIFNGYFEDKNLADKYGRHYLCKKCHDIYERLIPTILLKHINNRIELIKDIKKFSEFYFNKEGENGNTQTTPK
jgi:hypothetical protein